MSRHWQYQFVDKHWVSIWSQTLIDAEGSKKKLPFSIQKELVKEFKLFEKTLTIHPDIIGWISWTKLVHTHMMIIFTKAGAQPYYINPKLKHLWFRKVLNRR